MASKNIEKLIVKYLTNQATFIELDELELWLRDLDNENEFSNFIKANYLIEYNLKKFNSVKTKKKLYHLIKEEGRVLILRRIQKYSKYAAILVGVMMSLFFFRDAIFQTSIEKESIIVNTVIESGTDKATLTLKDGSVVTLEKGNTYQTQNANSNGEEIVYEARDRNSTEIAYNYLTIPRGGEFFIKLSDGTQVWLNSESQLKYPISFTEGETREVELVYGEAYFDVSPSTDHGGANFKVMSQIQEVEVLGTEFNIKAYKDETTIYTTLVEGKVAIGNGVSKQNLIPNQQSKIDSDNNIIITTVDVYNEISWKDGVFSFEKKPLKDIMKVLSRWYDIKVVYNDESLKEVIFYGVLGKDQSINEILETIKKFKIIESYEINNKVITLK